MYGYREFQAYNAIKGNSTVNSALFYSQIHSNSNVQMSSVGYFSEILYPNKQKIQYVIILIDQTQY